MFIDAHYKIRTSRRRIINFISRTCYIYLMTFQTILQGVYIYTNIFSFQDLWLLFRNPIFKPVRPLACFIGLFYMFYQLGLVHLFKWRKVPDDFQCESSPNRRNCVIGLVAHGVGLLLFYSSLLELLCF